MRSDIIDVEVEYIRETEKAWCVCSEVSDDVWVPKSQAELTRRSGSSLATLTLQQRVAKEKGLI